MTANEHTGVLGPMHGKEWKKGGGKEYNGDNEPTAEFEMTLDKLEPGQAGVILELNTGGGMRRRLMDLGFSAGEHVECVLKSPPGAVSYTHLRATRDAHESRMPSSA